MSEMHKKVIHGREILSAFLEVKQQKMLGEHKMFKTKDEDIVDS